MTPEDKTRNFFCYMFFPYWISIGLKEIIEIEDH